jgi:cyclase
MEEFFSATSSKTIMAYKRLVGVVPVKDGLVVKSYGYRFWRPAGQLRTALKNLDRWQVDEILVLDISRRTELDPSVVREIRASHISTPLAYGGGIRKKEHVSALLAAGCERFVVETMLFESPEKIEDLARKIGAQALIASLPISATDGGDFKADPACSRGWAKQGNEHDLKAICRRLNELPVAEVLAIDRAGEGCAGSFSLMNARGSHPLEDLRKGIIWFGGISLKQAEQLLQSVPTVAVGFGNANLEREVAMRLMRRFLLLRICKQETSSVAKMCAPSVPDTDCLLKN